MTFVSLNCTDWLSTLDEGIVPVSEVPIQQPATISQSTSIDILNEPIVSSTSASLETPVKSTYRPYRKPGLPLVLSEEEQRLLAEEGVSLPTDVALTKVCGH